MKVWLLVLFLLIKVLGVDLIHLLELTKKLLLLSLDLRQIDHKLIIVLSFIQIVDIVTVLECGHRYACCLAQQVGVAPELEDLIGLY